VGRSGFGRGGCEGGEGGVSGEADRTAGRRPDVIEAQEAAVGAVWREALDLRVDEAGIDGLTALVVDPQPLHAAGTKVLYEDVGIDKQPPEDRSTLGVTQVECDAALVGVEEQEVVRVQAGPVRGRATGLLATSGRFDLYHVSTKPGQRFGA